MPSRLLSCWTYLPQYIMRLLRDTPGMRLGVVVRVDDLVAAVGLDDRRDDRDDVVADALDERRLLDDEAVRELHQHLRAAGLGRVHAARDPVDRLRGLDQRARLRFRRLARVGEQRRGRALYLSRFLMMSSLPTTSTLMSRPSSDLPIVQYFARAGAAFAIDARYWFMSSLLSRMPHAPMMWPKCLQRRRHRARRREVIDEFGRDARVAHELLDLLRVLLVVLLLRERRTGRRDQRGGGERRAEDAVIRALLRDILPPFLIRAGGGMQELLQPAATGCNQLLGHMHSLYAVPPAG